MGAGSTRGDRDRPAEAEAGRLAPEVALLEAFYEAFNGGDIDAAAGFLTDDFEWRPAFGRAVMGGNAYVGPAGFRRYWADLQDAFERYVVDVRAVERAGADRLLVTVRSLATGRTSGIDVDREFVIVYELRGGRISRGETHPDRADALRAAGLS